MSKHVLVPMVDSPMADRALEYAVSEHPDAEITVLHVIDFANAAAGSSFEGSVPAYTEQWYETETDAAEELFEHARELAGRDVETEHVVGRPAASIVEYAEDNDVTHVVMGSHGRTGVSRVLLGSVAETVVRRAPVPVTIVR